MLELRKEDGSLNAYCAVCGTRLEKTIEDIRELACSGLLTKLEVLCPKCQAKAVIELQLGKQELGIRKD